MADQQYQRLLHDVYETRRKAGMGDRVGTVHQVWRKDGVEKIRVRMGDQSDGTPWLSPWLHTEDHRGVHRQQEKYHVGMNVKMSSVDGDWRKASVSPWAENDKHKEPDHANDYDHTYQHDTLLERHGTDFQRLTLAKKDDSGGGGSKLSEDKFEVRITMGEPPQRQGQGQAWDGPKGNDGKPKGVYTVESTTSITLKVGDSSIVIETDKITIKSAKIVTDGPTYLGSPDADKKVGGKDSVDTGGDKLATKLADQVWIKLGV